jgi:hypothetical protein
MSSKYHRKRGSTVAAVMFAASVLASAAHAQNEPVGGQPGPGAIQTVPDLEAQVAYQRAFEAVLWAMSASAIYRFRVGLLEQPGMADNVITAFSGPLKTIHELITPNQVTPYIGGTSDLRNGPVVLEVPAKSDKAVLYGQIVDAWQATMAFDASSGQNKPRPKCREIMEVCFEIHKKQTLPLRLQQSRDATK